MTNLPNFTICLTTNKTNSSLDRKTLLALNGGAQWTRDFKPLLNGLSRGFPDINQICLNITGFIQPAYIVKLLSQDDYDDFNDQQLYVCPAEHDVDYDELVPFDPNNNPQLKCMYEIIGNFHKDPVRYNMGEDAHELFKIKNEENSSLGMMKIGAE